MRFFVGAHARIRKCDWRRCKPVIKKGVRLFRRLTEKRFKEDCRNKYM